MARNQGLYRHDKDERGLTKQQREVLDCLENQKLNQMQTADALGLSRQRVRQIVVDLMAKGFTITGARPPKTVTTK